MARSTKVLAVTVAGIFLAIAASGVAFADKLPPQPVLPQPSAGLAGHVVVTQSNVLKFVRPLTSLQKVALIKTATSTTPTEQSFDSPIRMNVRTPYIDSTTFLAVYDAGFNPFFDPPEFLVRGQGAAAYVHFHAQPERTYLIDCSIDPGTVAQFQTYVVAGVPGGAVPANGDSATVRPPSDNHLTFVVRKDPAARDMEIHISGGTTAHWRLGTCEITPIRGV